MRFPRVPLFLLMTLILPALAPAKDLPFYIGTYTAPHGKGEGIYRCVLDTETGALRAPVLVAPAQDPSWLVLSRDGKRLYAALEGSAGGIASYRLGENGVLDPLQSFALTPKKAGDMGPPCHLSFDGTGRFLLAAAYGTGTVASFAAAEDGTLTPVAALHFTGSGPNLSRQKESHAHQIVVDAANRFAYTCDLGGDDVVLFAFDPASGALTPRLPFPKMPPGSGPRHLAFTPDGRFAYVNGELDLTVTAFARDPDSGALAPLQTLSTRPEGMTLPDGLDASGAEVLCHPSGRWLYASNRGWDTLAVFRIGTDGKLAPVENKPIGVQGPRAIAIDPSGKWMLAAGQRDDSVVVLKLDPETGAATPTDQKQAVGSPVALLFAP